MRKVLTSNWPASLEPNYFKHLKMKPSVVPWGDQPISPAIGSYPTNERPLPAKDSADYCPSQGLPASFPHALLKNQGPLPGSLDLPVVCHSLHCQIAILAILKVTCADKITIIKVDKFNAVPTRFSLTFKLCCQTGFTLQTLKH